MQAAASTIFGEAGVDAANRRGTTAPRKADVDVIAWRGVARAGVD